MTYIDLLKILQLAVLLFGALHDISKIWRSDITQVKFSVYISDVKNIWWGKADFDEISDVCCYSLIVCTLHGTLVSIPVLGRIIMAEVIVAHGWCFGGRITLVFSSYTRPDPIRPDWTLKIMNWAETGTESRKENRKRTENKAE